MARLAALATWIGFSGCALPPRSVPPAATREPAPRMVVVDSLPPDSTGDRVRAVLGDPASLERDGNGAEIWTFPAGRAPWPELAGSTVRVRFQDGRVRAVEAVSPRP